VWLKKDVASARGVFIYLSPGFDFYDVFEGSDEDAMVHAGGDFDGFPAGRAFLGGFVCESMTAAFLFVFGPQELEALQRPAG
jgi:hypothetical protein